MADNWKSPINEYENVALEDVKFMFAQAEKKLDDTIKVADTTTTRSFTILTALVGLVLALSGFFFADFTKEGVKDRNILAGVAVNCLYSCPHESQW